LYSNVHFVPKTATWKDIIGYTEVKKILDGSVGFPFRMPHLFSGRKNDSKFKKSTGCLLYGPPGTGKSEFARCLASEAKENTFVTITGADVNGKFCGETEKNITALFQLSEAIKPVIVFLDEAETVFTSRNGNVSENTQKAVAQFLTYLQKQPGLFLLACSNHPYNIDSGILRRMPTKIFIGLPDSKARGLMLKHHLKEVMSFLTDNNYKMLGSAMVDFSASDIYDVATMSGHEVYMKVPAATHFRSCMTRKGQMVPCKATDIGAVEGTYEDFPADCISAPILRLKDVQKAIKVVNLSRNKVEPEYMEALEKFGAEQK
jgi:vacuolar protein-sorting-associated protein 4